MIQPVSEEKEAMEINSLLKGILSTFRHTVQFDKAACARRFGNFETIVNETHRLIVYGQLGLPNALLQRQRSTPTRITN